MRFEKSARFAWRASASPALPQPGTRPSRTSVRAWPDPRHSDSPLQSPLSHRSTPPFRVSRSSRGNSLIGVVAPVRADVAGIGRFRRLACWVSAHFPRRRCSQSPSCSARQRGLSRGLAVGSHRRRVMMALAMTAGAASEIALASPRAGWRSARRARLLCRFGYLHALIRSPFRSPPMRAEDGGDGARFRRIAVRLLPGRSRRRRWLPRRCARSAPRLSSPRTRSSMARWPASRSGASPATRDRSGGAVGSLLGDRDVGRPKGSSMPMT